jgi:hypothetical protein
MLRNVAQLWLLALVLVGCSVMRQDAAATTVRHRFAQPTAQAAACFARNAEEHSSALVSEVHPPNSRGQIEVVVRVKNGITYATAEIRPAARGSDGTLTLGVVSSRGARELVDSLVEGC